MVCAHSPTFEWVGMLHSWHSVCFLVFLSLFRFCSCLVVGLQKTTTSFFASPCPRGVDVAQAGSSAGATAAAGGAESAAAPAAAAEAPGAPVSTGGPQGDPFPATCVADGPRGCGCRFGFCWAKYEKRGQKLSTRA